MQDKEFDSLFRSKLENFEAVPTGQVWDGIVEGLGSKRRYAPLLPWLSIAASVLVLVTAGVLFIPRKATVTPKHSIAAVKQQPAPVITHDPVKPQHREIIPTPAAVNRIAQVKPAQTKVVFVAQSPAPETVPANEAKPKEQQIIAAVQPKEVISPEAPGSQTQITAPQTIDMPAAATTKPVIAATMPNIADKQSIATARPKHKAHGIGGFLNTVIAAVDKRKDKIIEFTESDDDDGSNVTAVNLGILKFKKDKAEVSSLTK